MGRMLIILAWARYLAPSGHIFRFFGIFANHDSYSRLFLDFILARAWCTFLAHFYSFASDRILRTLSAVLRAIAARSRCIGSFVFSALAGAHDPLWSFSRLAHLILSRPR